MSESDLPLVTASVALLTVIAPMLASRKPKAVGLAVVNTVSATRVASKRPPPPRTNVSAVVA